MDPNEQKRLEKINQAGLPSSRWSTGGKPATGDIVPPPLIAPGDPKPELIKDIESRSAEAPLDLFPADYLPFTAAARLKRATAEQARRRIEALQLYEPLPLQEDFHQSRSRIRLVRGSNRSGKTIATSVEVARAVTGQDPYGKYPLRDGRAFLIGKDLDHIGQVMWRKLSRPGAFKILRDPETGQWRAYRPWVAEDLKYVHLTKPAPPLIPPRFIKRISWEKKAANIPELVVLHNGWEMSFYSSLGKPPRGSDLDLVDLDEEIVDRDWIPEMQARIVDRGGKIIWGATPQTGTEQLFDLHERAEKEALKPKPSVSEYHILLRDNPHVTEEEKELFSKDLSDDERRVRVGGEFAFVSYLVYPEFSRTLHCIAPFPVPMNWARYMIVDPGHQICAVLFAAVPPLDHGDYIYLYDELYLESCNAAKFAQAVAEKVKDQAIQAFMMDYHMGIHTEVGIGRTVKEQYSSALREERVQSITTGSDFLPASDDVAAGITAAHGLLRNRGAEGPRIRIFEGVLPAFQYEISRYRNRVISGVIQDAPNQRRDNHLMDCFRYLAAYNPRYIKPKPVKQPARGAVAAYRAKKERNRHKDGDKYVNLGPAKQGA